MLVAVGFPVTSKSKFSILFEDRLDNHVLLCPLLVSSLSCSLCRMNRCISSEVSFNCSSCSLLNSRFASTKSGR